MYSDATCIIPLLSQSIQAKQLGVRTSRDKAIAERLSQRRKFGMRWIEVGQPRHQRLMFCTPLVPTGIIRQRKATLAWSLIRTMSYLVLRTSPQKFWVGIREGDWWTSVDLPKGGGACSFSCLFFFFMKKGKGNQS